MLQQQVSATRKLNHTNGLVCKSTSSRFYNLFLYKLIQCACSSNYAHKNYVLLDSVSHSRYWTLTIPKCADFEIHVVPNSLRLHAPVLLKRASAFTGSRLFNNSYCFVSQYVPCELRTRQNDASLHSWGFEIMTNIRHRKSVAHTQDDNDKNTTTYSILLFVQKSRQQKE